MAKLKWDKSVLLTQIGDDQELAGELLNIFKSSSEKDLQKIKDGIICREATIIAEAAHNVKGSAVSLGIEGLRQIAYMVEMAAREGSVEKAAEYVDELESLLKEFHEMSKLFLAE